MPYNTSKRLIAKPEDFQRILSIIPTLWCIRQISWHWTLDVAIFSEDASRKRIGNAAQNLIRLCR